MKYVFLKARRSLQEICDMLNKLDILELDIFDINNTFLKTISICAKQIEKEFSKQDIQFKVLPCLEDIYIEQKKIEYENNRP